MFRFLSIIKILLIYRFDKLLPNTFVIKIFKVLLFFLPYFYYKEGKLPEAQRIVAALEKLGVIFVKFGQTLSTRIDLLPEHIIKELAKLQDNCTPFSNQDAFNIIEKSLQKPIFEIFDNFSKQPLAAASIAQVYHANLKEDNSEVVIKVVRPGIDKQIKKDIKLLYKLAKIIKLHPQLKRVRPLQIVKEFEYVITAELNMNIEAANAQLLKDNFKNSKLLYVPKVYFDYCTKDILIMERIYGTPISDVSTLKAKNINLKTLAENGVKIFFNQVFRDNFFHADMHPGNIFVADDGKYLGVDFGIMGMLLDKDLKINADLFSAFFARDYKKIAATFVTAGWVGSDINIIALEQSMRGICEPIFAKPLHKISFGTVLMSLFKEANKFDAYIQPQFFLFDKTLLNIEGLGRNLYPELDLWATAKPLLDDIMEEKFSLKNKIKTITNEAQKLPKLGIDLLQNIAAAKDRQTNQIIQQLQKNNTKQNYLLLAIILLLLIV